LLLYISIELPELIYSGRVLYNDNIGNINNCPHQCLD
jgi:hypothetical protein